MEKTCQSPRAVHKTQVAIELRSEDRRWYLSAVGEAAAGAAVYCEQCRYWFDATLRYGFSSRTQRLFNAMAPTALALDAWSDWLCGFQIFNPTSMCAYSNGMNQTLWLCFENSTRAIDSSKSRPNRLRFDRAREF